MLWRRSHNKNYWENMNKILQNTFQFDKCQNYIKMIKNDPKALQSNEAICKKIQNYIFKFTDMLGKGNFSKVYKAHHEITNQIVAVKIIELNSLKSQKLEELLFSEIDVLKKLNHPNILRCFEVFTSNRNCYIITEICNGGDLETKLRKEHHFSQQSAQPIIKDIFSGLLYLAEKNVIHRDLKVANIFLHNGRGKIADFGFAKFTKDNFKDINIGSPIYMAPEGLIHNVYGPKTDVWAFGIFIFELLHGETPYAHCRTEAQLKYHISVPFNEKKLRHELSTEIKQIILRCLEIDESKRVTFQQLSTFPYFQRLMERSPLRRADSPPIDKKFSATSQKYISGNSKQLLDKHNFLLPQRVHDSSQPTIELDSMKKNSSKFLPVKNIMSQNRELKNYSMEKRVINRMTRQRQTHRYENANISSRPLSPKIQVNTFGIGSSKIFSSSISFKQCVNLLHYCRLVYKFAIFMRESLHHDDGIVNFFSVWVLTLMDEIKNKINENGVSYDGDNGWLRQKKLREVINEYTKKYQTELFAKKDPDVSISAVESFGISVFDKLDSKISVDSSDQDLLILGHYIVMIIQGTNYLKKCYNEKSYKIMGGYRQLEIFLNTKKQKMDSQSYKLIRKKKAFIH